MARAVGPARGFPARIRRRAATRRFCPICPTRLSRVLAMAAVAVLVVAVVRAVAVLVVAVLRAVAVVRFVSVIIAAYGGARSCGRSAVRGARWRRTAGDRSLCRRGR